MRKYKTDWQVTKKAIWFLFEHGIVCFAAYAVWRFTLGFYFPVAGNIIGIASALCVFFLMMFFRGANVPFDELPVEEEKRLKKDIVWMAAFKSSKKLAKIYQQCDLKKGIYEEYIDPKTGCKYSLIFRKMRNERVQSSNVRRPLQEGKKAKENLQDKATVEEEAGANERIYTEGATLFRETS